MSPTPRPYPNNMIEDAINAALLYFSTMEALVNRQDLVDRSRDAYTIKVRAVVMYFLKVEGHLSYPAIGALFDRDHTSVINMVRRVHDLVDLDDLETIVDFVKDRVASGMTQRHAALTGMSA